MRGGAVSEIVTEKEGDRGLKDLRARRVRADRLEIPDQGVGQSWGSIPPSPCLWALLFSQW